MLSVCSAAVLATSVALVTPLAAAADSPSPAAADSLSPALLASAHPDAADPFGRLDGVTVEPGRVIARGWAIDPDTAGSVIVQMYVDGREYTLGWANQSRPDVGGVYPAFGPDHGFAIAMEVDPDAGHSVCVYAINTGPGTHTKLGCRNVEGPPFFVYGSLRSGQSAHYLVGPYATGLAGTRLPAHDMYRVTGSAFPYAVGNPDNDEGIVGEVITIRPGDYAATVDRLDRYERYDPTRPPDNQIYVRVLSPTREETPAWVYVAGPRQAQYLRSEGTLISSGDFLRW